MKRTKQTILGMAVFAACGVPDRQPALDGGSGHVMGTGSGEREMVISAASTTNWVYFSRSSGGVVTLADPAQSRAWDLRFRRTQVGSNSGTSGPGGGGALDTGATAIARAPSCPADGYQADKMLPIPGPPGSGEYSGNPVLNEWFDYDPATHAVSSKSHVYCVRAADGQSLYFHIHNYASGQLTIHWK